MTKRKGRNGFLEVDCMIDVMDGAEDLRNINVGINNNICGISGAMAANSNIKENKRK